MEKRRSKTCLEGHNYARFEFWEFSERFDFSNHHERWWRTIAGREETVTEIWKFQVLLKVEEQILNVGEREKDGKKFFFLLKNE